MDHKYIIHIKEIPEEKRSEFVAYCFGKAKPDIDDVYYRADYYRWKNNIDLLDITEQALRTITDQKP